MAIDILNPQTAGQIDRGEEKTEETPTGNKEQ